MTPSSASASAPANNASGYRPDIDGLRAIAVLSVILYHIEPTLIPGGFVGVDIFFVISGYLISLYIFRELDAQRFSIAEFYRRRIKRIAPAMLAVILATLVVSQHLLRPADAENVAESAVWSLMSMANVYFWLFEDTSYFAAASDEKPLLHLWSLGVEEQFYIIWPLLLLLIARQGWGRKAYATIGVMAVASFLLGQWLYAASPSFVYYMLPSRIGELLIGAFLAQYVNARGHERSAPNQARMASVIGFVLIGLSLFLVSDERVFPGFQAIPPTVGAALLIYAGHIGNPWLSRLLSTRPMVTVGLMSYSAYLWHWPLLAFYRYGFPEMTVTAGVSLFAATLIIAWFSYRWIETPFRHAKGGFLPILAKQYVLPCSILGILALASMKIDGYGLRLMSDDYQTALTSIRDKTRPAYHSDYVCQSQIVTEADTTDRNCVLGPTDDREPEVLLWGDSNAAHYIGILGSFAEASGFAFRNLQIGACPPIDADAADFAPVWRIADCRASQSAMLAAVDRHPVVIISANWSDYQGRSDAFLSVFYDTVGDLTREGKKIILIGKAPIIDGYDRLCREKAVSYPGIDCTVDDVPLAPEVATINDQLKGFAQRSEHVEYTDFNSYLCPDNVCSSYDDNGELIYYDTYHLSLPASWAIGRTLLQQGGVPFPFNRIEEWTRQAETAFNRPGG